MKASKELRVSLPVKPLCKKAKPYRSILKRNADDIVEHFQTKDHGWPLAYDYYQNFVTSEILGFDPGHEMLKLVAGRVPVEVVYKLKETPKIVKVERARPAKKSNKKQAKKKSNKKKAVRRASR